MILRFSIENLFSFRERQTLDLTPCSDCSLRTDDNVFTVAGEQMLTSVAVYGANASGKSNLFAALSSFINLVVYSFDEMYHDKIPPFTPFFHDEACMGRPSLAELEFILKGKCYKYGYALVQSHVVKEWLLKKVSGDYQILFIRHDNEGRDVIDVRHENFLGVNELIVANTRKDALFLSTCTKMAVAEAKDILDEFHYNVNVVSAERRHAAYTAHQMYTNKDFYHAIAHFIEQTDPSIEKIVLKEELESTGRISQSGHSVMMPKYEIRVVPKDAPKGLSENGGIPFDAIVSSGTKKAFDLAGPIFDSLRYGKTLVVDEFGVVMHPILSREVLLLFNSQETNPMHAQLIFNTHDTNLLNATVYNPTLRHKESLLRPDQVYFVERGRDHASRLYSRAEYDPTPESEGLSAEDEYLEGRYGSIPYIGSLLGEKRKWA